MSSNFPYLKQHIDKIIPMGEQIAARWVDQDALAPLFSKYNMETDYFKRQHAKAIFEHVVKRIKEDKDIEDSSIDRLVEYLRNRDVIMEDLFLIYSMLTQVMVRASIEMFPGDIEPVVEFQKLSDQIHHTIISKSNRSIFAGENSLEDQLQLFKEYQKVIDKSAIVSKTDTRGVITYVNAAFLAISGYTKEELIGKPHSIVRHPDMSAAVFKKMWKTIKAKKIFNGTIKNRKRDGSAYFVDATVIPILDRENNIIEYIAMRYDVTKFAQAVAAAKRAEKAKEEFLSNMSHEIRTPLNAIMGFVQLLVKTTKDTKALEKLNIVYQSSQSLLDIINDILDFSKIESGHFKIDPHDLHLSKDLGSVFELFAAKMQEKNITFLTYIDPNIPSCVIADGTRIKQIVNNLLSNAVKFTPEEGKIEVDVRLDEKTKVLDIAVIDSGIGIAKEQLTSIFNAFEQADGSISRKFGGTGLGLSISNRLAKLMNGEIILKSTIDVGSRFELMIPVEVCTDQQESEAMPVKAMKVALLHSAEDETEKSRFALIERYLRAFGIDSIEYIDQLEERRFDCIIFNGQTISESVLDIITHLDTKTIAFMPMHSSLYDDHHCIEELTFPLNVQKVYTALNEKMYLPVSDENIISLKLKGSVLVAEDNHANQQLIKVYLDEYGLEVVFANNGKEAVEQFRSRVFDLILMDNQMSPMDGVEATMLILEHERINELKHTPIVALTANQLEGEREYFLEIGMDGFLAKPISSEQLKHLLQCYLLPDETTIAVTSKTQGSDMETVKIEVAPFVKTISSMAQTMGIKESHVRMILSAFIEECEELLEKLYLAIAESDYEQIRLIAHSLRGSAGNLQLKEFSEHCKQMEYAANTADSTFDHPRVFEVIIHLFEEVKQMGS